MIQVVVQVATLTLVVLEVHQVHPVVCSSLPHHLFVVLLPWVASMQDLDSLPRLVLASLLDKCQRQ